MMLAGERFCQEDWSKLKQKYPTLEEEDLLQYCFSSAYIIALLHDSLGIALEDTRCGMMPYFIFKLGHDNIPFLFLLFEIFSLSCSIKHTEV